MKKIFSFLLALSFYVTATAQAEIKQIGDTVRIARRGSGDAILDIKGLLQVSAIPTGASTDSLVVWDPVLKRVKKITRSSLLSHTHAQGQVTSLPDSLLNKVSRDGSYADPYWLTALAWAKITSTPTTKAGYNITDVPTYSDSTSWLAGRWLPNRSSDTATALQSRIQTKQPIGNYLVSGNNLADVTNTATARNNLGLANGALFDTSTIQPRFDLKEPSITAGTTAQYWRGDKSWQTLNSASVGLGNVDNKSSITIRSEITSLNVTTALGFTPENLANKGIAAGYADLDALGKIPASRIDFGQTGQTFVVASQAAMLAVSSANVGALAIRTDENKNYRLIAQPASTLANWQVLLSPDAPVQSVNGFTGNVNMLTTHISEGSNYYWTAARSRAAQSLTTTGTSGAATYDNTTGVFNIPVYQAAGTYLTNFSFTNSTGITGTVTNPTTTPALALSIDSSAISNFHIKVRSLFTAGSGISISNGTISSTITQYTDALARAAISAGTGISYNSTTGIITNTITQYTDALARSTLSFTAGSGAYNSTTGVITIPTDNNQIANSAGYITNATSGLVNYYTSTQIQNFYSGASAITGYNYSNWNTAYSWGNHAGLYLPLSGGTISGPVTYTNQIVFTQTSQGTGQGYGRFTNAGNNTYIGVVNSLGSFFNGSTAYATTLGNTENVDLQLATFNAVRLTLNASAAIFTVPVNTGVNSITAGAASFSTGVFSGTTSSSILVTNAVSGSDEVFRMQSYTGSPYMSWYGDGTIRQGYIQANGATSITFGTDGNRHIALIPGGTGNVGIGTVSPTATTSAKVLEINGGASNSELRFTTTSTGSGTADGLSILIDGSGIGYLYNRENAGLVFGTNNTTALTIASNQTATFANSVGVGITATAEMLNVKQITGNASAALITTVSVTAGQSYGLTVQAGTNSSDRSFLVSNQGGTVDYFKIRGDGVISMPANIASTSYTTGALVVTGGVGISGAIYANSTLNVAGAITCGSLIKSGGTSSQFLKADGSVDANDYLTTASASLYSGEYTPATGTDSTNCVYASNGTLTYSRNGNAVTISGSFKVNPAGAGDFFYAIGLPAGWTISSTTTGGGAANTGTSTAANVILKPYSSTKIGINGYATSTGIRTFFFTAQFTLTGL